MRRSFGSSRGQLDGQWAWEDTDAAYLLIDSLALKDEAGSLARFLFEDFTHYFTTRKAREEFCVLIVDEFSALAQAGSMASRIEQARGFHTALILAPQVAAGMGDETETARIMGSAETVICHRVSTPQDIVELAGTRLRMEHSVQYATPARPESGPRDASTSTRSTPTACAHWKTVRLMSSAAAGPPARASPKPPRLALHCRQRRHRQPLSHKTTPRRRPQP